MAATARIDQESRLEGLRVELSGVASVRHAPERSDPQGRNQEGQQSIVRRTDQLEARFDGLWEELWATGGRLDAWHAAAAKEAEATRHELVQRLNHWREEVSKDQCKIKAAVDVLRQDASRELGEATQHIESLKTELATAVASRESIREAKADFRKLIDVSHSNYSEEMSTLREQLASEVEALQRSQRRLETETEASRVESRDGLAVHQQRVKAELHAEMQALVKGPIAALDQQLWRTDQLLGQRIDELSQATERSDRAAAVATAELAARVWTPRSAEAQEARGCGLIRRPESLEPEALGRRLERLRPASARSRSVSTSPGEPPPSKHGHGGFAMAAAAAQELADRGTGCGVEDDRKEAFALAHRRLPGASSLHGGPAPGAAELLHAASAGKGRSDHGSFGAMA